MRKILIILAIPLFFLLFALPFIFSVFFIEKESTGTPIVVINSDLNEFVSDPIQVSLILHFGKNPDHLNSTNNRPLQGVVFRNVSNEAILSYLKKMSDVENNLNYRAYVYLLNENYSDFAVTTGNVSLLDICSSDNGRCNWSRKL